MSMQFLIIPLDTSDVAMQHSWLHALSHLGSEYLVAHFDDGNSRGMAVDQSFMELAKFVCLPCVHWCQVSVLPGLGLSRALASAKQN